jgi:hypothetical protein
MTENHDPIERTLEVLLYAPLGFSLFLKDTAPTFINMFISRGRAEVDRRHEEVQQHVTTARSLGQVTMAFGPPIVRERGSRPVADARRRAEALLGTVVPDAASSDVETEPTPDAAVPTHADERTPSPTSSSPPASPITFASTPSGQAPVTPSASESSNGTWSSESAGTGDAARSAGLPIPGYDALSASQVVERLVGLAPDELDAVHRYEASHRRRRTILGKIEQLAG